MKRAMAVTLTALGLCACPGPNPNTDACSARKVGDLVITEVMIDPDGIDTGNEWIEVFNTLGTPLDLRGITLFMREGASATKTHTIRAGTVPARGYFTLGDVRSGPNPQWINYSYGADLGSLPSASATLGLRCGTALTIDQMQYTRAAKPARSRMLNGALGGLPIDPDATTNDDETRWCDTPPGHVYLGSDNGTPQQPNPECLPEATLGTCIDATTNALRPVVPPGAGEVIVTEVLANPSVREATQEWFEVLALRSVDLNDVTVATATATDKLTASKCLRVEAGSYAIIARSADPFVNGDLPAPLITTTLSLANSNERLSLVLGDAGIDMAAITTSANGVAWQLDPTLLSAAANDDPASFCHATQPWGADGGGDWGTPAAANTACPARPDGGTDSGVPDAGDPNSCFDPGLGASRPIDRPVVGDVVLTEVMADPVLVADTAGEWFELLVKRDLDLNGVVLASEGTAASDSTTLSSSACMRVDAGTWALFAHSADPAVNGGLPPVAATFSFGLANSGALQTRFVRASSQGTELDRLAYPVTSTAVIAGASVMLVGGKVDPADNDVLANLCNAPTSQRFTLTDGGVGERGTPGAANGPCI